MRRGNRAFTIVELAVIITVIAILATIGVFSFIAVQQTQRNNQRSSSVTIMSEALEKYYDENGEYPGCGAMTPPDPQTVAANTLKNIDVSIFKAPRAPSTEKNSVRCGDLTASTAGDIFAYLGENSPACRTGAACSEWKLKYREEGSNDIVTIASRRTAQEHGDSSTLAAQAISITRIDLTWPAAAGASSYEVQRSTTASFNSITTTSYAGTAVSASVTGLSADTMYYFRIRPITSSGTGSWSAAVNAKTLPVVAPATVTTSAAVYLTTNVRGTIISSCINGASLQYQIRYKEGAAAYSAWETYTSGKVVAAVIGTSYTFQGQARCTGGGSTSGWTLGTEATAARAVPTPTGTTSSATLSGTSAIGTASGAVCSTGLTVEYRIRYNFSPTVTQGTWSSYATGPSATTAALQGHKYIFQPQARCKGLSADSAWVTGATSSVVRAITAPMTPTLSVSTSGQTSTFTRNDVACPTGTTSRYGYKYMADWGYDSIWYGPTTGVSSIDWSTDSQGYEYKLLMRAQCYTTHNTSPWSGTRTASYTRPVSTPTGIAWSFQKSGDRILYMKPSGTCHSSVHFFGSMDEWVGGGATWPGGRTGWYTSNGGYRVVDQYNPSGGVQQPTQYAPYRSGNQFNARGLFRCKNYTTGRQSGTVTHTRGTYTW